LQSNKIFQIIPNLLNILVPEYREGSDELLRILYENDNWCLQKLRIYLPFLEF
jgi:hypothetical protein